MSKEAMIIEALESFRRNDTNRSPLVTEVYEELRRRWPDVAWKRSYIEGIKSTWSRTHGLKGNRGRPKATREQILKEIDPPPPPVPPAIIELIANEIAKAEIKGYKVVARFVDVTTVTSSLGNGAAHNMEVAASCPRSIEITFTKE